MQLGRSYYRRLKSVNNEIYELLNNARYAYRLIRPAVKTSRPQVFNDRFIPVQNRIGVQRYDIIRIFAFPKIVYTKFIPDGYLFRINQRT